MYMWAHGKWGWTCWDDSQSIQVKQQQLPVSLWSDIQPDVMILSTQLAEADAKVKAKASVYCAQLKA